MSDTDAVRRWTRILSGLRARGWVRFPDSSMRSSLGHSAGQGNVVSYDLEGKELWRVTRMAMPTASP